MKQQPGGALRREINTMQLWAIAVGLVISGEYFGWNYGWAVSGTIGFLLSTLLVTLMYVSFIFSYTELTAAIPQAGGAFSYAKRALGPLGGFLAGFATLVDFLLAPPAIAYALGSYTNFLYPAIPVVPAAMLSYAVFIGVNLLGIKEAAQFSLVVTLLSVGEILLFMGLIAPSFEWQNFIAHNPELLHTGHVFAGIPYAIWFFVAIEGVAMVAEEVKTPQKTIVKGYLCSIGTLVLLVLGIMILSGGIGDWRLLTDIDHPLPETLAMALGNNNIWAKIFTSLGLFGLIASFHGNTISYSRQIYAMAREGFLPSFLTRLNKHQTPHWALISGGLIGFVAILSGKTDQIIILSVLGAVVMYVFSMVSLLVLRAKEPNLPRPFQVPMYPYLPWTALILTMVCTVAIVYYNPLISLIFTCIMLLSLLWFAVVKNKISVFENEQALTTEEQ
ncbi:MAG: ethanolamine permease [Cytophagales bacterium]|nr:ethanolamine permease [Bernardetiaceae bacterium]MDW8203685.1 ethanolamine permease [Cytophagales bacterium]